MILLGARAHLKKNLAACTSAVLRHIARGYNIDLTDGINAGCGDHRPIGACPRGGRPLDLEIVGVAAHPVDVRILCSEQIHGLKTVEGEGLNDTRLKREESGEVAAVDRDFLDLGVVDDAGDPALLCL